MTNPELIGKLTGCVINNELRITGLVAEGSRAIVLGATNLRDATDVVLKLDKSSPMFLLNEADTFFLPLSDAPSVRAKRFYRIHEQLIVACKTDFPGLFFHNMTVIYERILAVLALDHREIGKPVMDLVTAAFQNAEFLRVGERTLARKARMAWPDLEYWEHQVPNDDLRVVVEVAPSLPFEVLLDFTRPLQLLALVFSEGFFGLIPTDDPKPESWGRDLARGRLQVVESEHVLADFLMIAGSAFDAATANHDLRMLKHAVQNGQAMFMEDAMDKKHQLSLLGEEFLARYRKGRNTFLRGMPRFVRVAEAWLSGRYASSFERDN
jgi:hypothetical protein